MSFNPELRLVTNTDDVRAMLNWVSSGRRMLAVDVETEGLRPSVHRTRLVQIGDSGMGWAIPADDWFGAFREAVRLHGDRMWVGHNIAGFDWRMLRQRGITLPAHQITDTLLAARLLDNTSRAALKPLAARLIDPRAAGASDELKRVYKAEGFNWATIPVDHPAYWRYSALDTCLTHAVAERILPQVEEAGFTELLDREVLVALILSAAADRGIPVDKAACEAATADVRGRQAEVARRLTEFGVTQPSAPRQIAAALESEGAKLTARTATGQASTDKAALEALAARGSVVAGLAVEWRNLEGTVVKYLDKLGRDFHDADGRVRCVYRSMEASTGRISVSDPPLQQIPKGDPTVRQGIVAGKNRSLVELDYQAIEPRLLAHFSKEPAWLDVLADGGDLHGVNAEALFGAAYTPKQRQVAKVYGLARAYGAGARKLAASTGMTEGRMRELNDRWARELPILNRFMRRCIDVAEQREAAEGQGYVRLPSGRVVRMDCGYTYKAVNCLVQGTAADVMKQALVDLMFAGLTDNFILTVHDSAVFEVDDDQVEDFARDAKKAMEDHNSFRVALPVDATAGKTWADQKELGL